MKKRMMIMFVFYTIFLITNLYSQINCAKCGKRINNESYYEIQGKNYCEKCYKKYFATYCSLCGKEIKGRYIFDFWQNKYHEFHKEDHDFCEYCARMICDKVTKGGRTYQDGTHICNLCYKSSVQRESKANILMKEVLNELIWLGIKIDPENIELQLVDNAQLSQKAIDMKINSHHKGLTKYTAFENQKGDISLENFTIYIVIGMPELKFIEVIAHELMHVWQYQNSPLDNDLAFSEGSCNYAAYLVLKKYKNKHYYKSNKEKSKMIDFLIMNLETNTDKIYGDGFRRVKELVEKHRKKYWLDHLKNFRNFP
ncbi:MAG: protein DA1 [Candidatus Cloacimonetes bacterium]|nr:protein DA1 [Candidatus Cloacimonadota bacterium]